MSTKATREKDKELMRQGFEARSKRQVEQKYTKNEERNK